MGFSSDRRRPHDRAAGQITGVDPPVVSQFENLGTKVPGGTRGNKILLAIPDQGGKPGSTPGEELCQA